MFKIRFNCIFSKLLLFLVAGVKSEKLLKEVQNHPNWKLLDQRGICGISLSNRIIGGKDASLGQYPWIARLSYTSKENNIIGYHCGGSIINERYVLSAAHCNPKLIDKAVPYIVRLGEHVASRDQDCSNGICAPPVQDIKVDKYICHRKFGSNQFFLDDICLVRVASPIQFNEFVRPICLPVYNHFNQDFEGKMFEVAGWGYVDVGMKYVSDVLQTLKVKVTSLKDCNAIYKRRNKIITNKQLCAGGVVGEDSCSGDSGGPLMAPFAINGPPRYYLVGIVSYGPLDCAKTTVSGVYTNVVKYMDWILDQIKK